MYATLETIFWIKWASVELIAIWKILLIRWKALTYSVKKTGDSTLLSPPPPPLIREKEALPRARAVQIPSPSLSGQTTLHNLPDWRRKWKPTLVFLPGKFQGQRSLMSYSPWGCKESDTTEYMYMQSKPHFCSIWSDNDVTFQLLFFIRRACIRLAWRGLLNQNTRALTPDCGGS